MMQQALRYLIRPLARFCVRHRIGIREVFEFLKQEFSQAAAEELAAQGSSANVSRISAITGIHRKDLPRLIRDLPKDPESRSVLSRVIGHWQQHSKFRTTSGRPRTLSISGTDSEFHELVRSVSADLNPYTVLQELERFGAVERTSQGLRLAHRVWVPKGDIKQGFEIASKDIADLLSTVEENVAASEPLHLHLRTEYDNIPAKFRPEIQEWLFREGSALHQRARNYMARFDRDENKTISAGRDRVRVVLGSFGKTEMSNES